MFVHYLEIVSNDVDRLTALYRRIHGLSFGPPDADLGQARVATRADGTLVGHPEAADVLLTLLDERPSVSCRHECPGKPRVGDALRRSTRQTESGPRASA